MKDRSHLSQAHRNLADAIDSTDAAKAKVNDAKANVQAVLDNIFSYHSPKDGQPERYNRLREAGKHLAQAILDCTPVCADQSAAIRKVREAVMTANAAIAINE